MTLFRFLRCAPCALRRYYGAHPTFVKNQRKFVPKMKLPETGTHADFPGAAALPIASQEMELIEEAQEKLLAQPFIDFPGVAPRAFHLYLVDQTADLMLIPRSFSLAGLQDRVAPIISEGNDVDSIVVKDENELNESQVRAAKDIVGEFSKRGSLLLCMPSGRRKIDSALNIAAKLKKKTLIVVHKSFLLSRWKERAEYLLDGVKVGIWEKGKDPSSDCDIVVADLQTLVSKSFKQGALLQQFGLTIVDECEYIAANDLTMLAFRLPSKYLLGLTSMVDRLDKMGFLFQYLFDAAAYHGPELSSREVIFNCFVGGKGTSHFLYDLQHEQHPDLLLCSRLDYLDCSAK